MCLQVAYLLQCRSSLCLLPQTGLLLSCFYIASIWLRRFLWVGHRRVVFTPSSLCVWSQRPRRSRQIILLHQGFFARTPSRIWRIVKICDVADRFLRKSFWFVLSIFSILCSMRLRSRALYLGSSWLIRGHPSSGRGGCIPLSVCLLCFCYIRHYSVGKVCLWISWSSILLGVFHQALLFSYF